MIGRAYRVSRDPKVDGTLSARVLSMLIPLFGPDVSYVSIGEAVNALDAYCVRSLEQTETVFASRQYTLVDYVRYVFSLYISPYLYLSDEAMTIHTYMRCLFLV